MQMMIIVFISFGSYLIGSIPFGLFITKIAGSTDIRHIGSGNIGATNVLRTGKKHLAAATLILDALKATVAVILVDALLPEPYFLRFIAGGSAFLGHLFPVWLKFKGGKGVASYLGLLFAFSLPSSLFFIFTWLITAILLRYSSLAALVSITLTPLVLFWTVSLPVSSFFAVISLIIWQRHSLNIKRLLTGTESRIKIKRA